MKPFKFILILTFCFSLLVFNVFAQQWRVFTTSNSPLPGNGISSVSIDANNVKWIGTGSGLAKLNGNNWTIYDTLNSMMPFMKVHVSAIDRYNNVWLGSLSGGGLAKFNGTTWTIYNTSNSNIPSNTVYSIAIDSLNNKWVGTGMGRLAKFNDTNWVIYTGPDFGIPHNTFWDIAVENHIKWFGMASAGVVKYNDTIPIVYNFMNSGIPSDDIRDIFIESTDIKWFATWFGGLAKFNINSNNWTIYNSGNSGIETNFIHSIIVSNGKKYIGTAGVGLKIFNDTNWITYNMNNSPLLSNSIQSVAIDRYNNKWISTLNGLVIFNESGIISVNNQTSNLPKEFILYQNYPNPFNPATKIQFQIPKRNFTALKIYDANGRLIETLAEKEFAPGTYEAEWNASGFVSGIYFYEIVSGSFRETKKMVLIK